MASKWWTLVAVCTGVFMLLLDITIVNVALPDIQRDLDASLSDLQWVIDAYALTLAALLLTAGSLADLLGRRRLFAIGTAGLHARLARSAAWRRPSCSSRSPAPARASAARSCSPPRSRCSSGAFSGKERGTAFVFFGATTGVAVAIGPVLGGVLTSGLSWHWIFWVNIPICVLAHRRLAAPRLRRRRDPHAGRPDWIGFVTFCSALGAAGLGLIRAASTAGATRGSSALRRVRGAAGGLRGQPAASRPPMFDLGLLRMPTFVGGLIAAFGVSASVFSLLTYLIIYVQNVLGFSAVAGRRPVPVPVRAVVRRRDHRRPADQPRARPSG